MREFKEHVQGYARVMMMIQCVYHVALVQRVRTLDNLVKVVLVQHNVVRRHNPDAAVGAWRRGEEESSRATEDSMRSLKKAAE